jgi:hypothetical protein
VAVRRPGGAGKRRGGGGFDSSGEGKRQRTMASLLTPEEKLGMPLETIIGACFAYLGGLGALPEFSADALGGALSNTD